jgi:hypothetical protein
VPLPHMWYVPSFLLCLVRYALDSSNHVLASGRPNGLKRFDPNKAWITVGPGENPSDFLDEYGQ